MRSDIGTNARLVESVHIWITPIQHAIQFENIAVGICATELVAGALKMLVWSSQECVKETNIKTQHECLLPSIVGRGILGWHFGWRR